MWRSVRTILCSSWQTRRATVNVHSSRDTMGICAQLLKAAPSSAVFCEAPIGPNLLLERITAARFSFVQSEYVTEAAFWIALMMVRATWIAFDHAPHRHTPPPPNRCWKRSGSNKSQEETWMCSPTLVLGRGVKPIDRKCSKRKTVVKFVAGW